MGEPYYTRPRTSVFQTSPSLKFFFDLPLYGQSNFEFEYLSEFVIEFKNILGYESEAQMGLIDEKNQKSKISCYCPFKAVNQFFGRMLLKLAENIHNGKNGIPFFCLFF
jgi:hypothetical protein